MAQAPQQKQMTAAQIAQMKNQQNAAVRNHVKGNAVEMTQLMQSFSIVPSTGIPNIIQFTPKNVGLLRRFYVEAIVTFNTAAGTTACVRSAFGPSNIFSNVQVVDFQNQSRINTSGYHLSVVNSVKSKASAPIGSAETSDTPLGFGSIFNCITSPATVAASTTGAISSIVYELPIAYSDDDLRGAIYMATTGANMQLLLTINPNFFLSNGSDQTQAGYIYTGTAPTITNVTVNIYQDYLDQLPEAGGKVLLPEQDLNTVYQLLSTNISGLAVGQNFGIPYTNLRTFLSTTLVYDNVGLYAGTDINNIGLQSANNTFIYQLSPRMISYKTRKLINADVPLGTYYFDHRKSPISTAQFGNMQMVINPSVVNSGAQVFACYEFMAARQTIAQAASLPIG